MKLFCILAVLPPAAILSAGGCASASARTGESAIIDFPGIKYPVWSSKGVLREVKVYYEMDRLQKEDEEPMVGWVKAPGVVYGVAYPDTKPWEDTRDVIHRFSYEGGYFLVGEYRYPAVRNSSLFIMKERSGSFTVLFHGRKVTVEHSTRWKPAVLYRAVEEKEEVGPARNEAPRNEGRTKRGITRSRVVTRLIQEELQVGPHRIVALPGKPDWTVNGSRIPAPGGASIKIDRRGNVSSSK